MPTALDLTVPERARELLAGHWAKGVFYDSPSQSYCLVGVFTHGLHREADVFDKNFAPIWAELSEVIREHFPQRVDSYYGEQQRIYPDSYSRPLIYDFNDHRDTTEADVLFVLDAVIAKENQ